jgi:hypothetical protein
MDEININICKGMKGKFRRFFKISRTDTAYSNTTVFKYTYIYLFWIYIITITRMKHGKS